MKLWTEDQRMDEEIEQFTVGSDYVLDHHLVKYDCMASIAHAKMLNKLKILDKTETSKIVEVLNEIIGLNKDGKFIIHREDEDCHTAIENYLTKKLGQTGKKIHTARSRNDQVLAALRLYYKENLVSVMKLVDVVISSLVSFKKTYGHIEMPGYTHMRKAMPSSVGLWSEAFIESFQEDKHSLQYASMLIDQNPLGTGAGYGLPIKVDRQMTAKLLGFSKIQHNPLYVQNSRGKFESCILHALLQCMLTMNKLASDVILFSMEQFGYLELSRKICTGSSIMPHKKNPDVLELLRAKYHEVLALEFQVKSTISNLVSGYNRDFQMTKVPVIKSFQIVKESLRVTDIVVANISVNEKRCKEAMTDELYSVQRAMELVKKNVPFREAYKKVSKE